MHLLSFIHRSLDGEAVVPFFRVLNLPYPPEAPDRGESSLSEIALFRVAPSSTPPYTPLPAATRDALDPADIFLLASPKGIYVWTGSKASNEEKRSAMTAAQHLIVEKGLRPETSIVRVVQGSETDAFWDAFDS